MTVVARQYQKRHSYWESDEIVDPLVSSLVLVIFVTLGAVCGLVPWWKPTKLIETYYGNKCDFIIIIFSNYHSWCISSSQVQVLESEFLFVFCSCLYKLVFMGLTGNICKPEVTMCKPEDTMFSAWLAGCEINAGEISTF